MTVDAIANSVFTDLIGTAAGSHIISLPAQLGEGAEPLLRLVTRVSISDRLLAALRALALQQDIHGVLLQTGRNGGR